MVVPAGPNPFALFLSVYGGKFLSVKGERDELVLVSKCTFQSSCPHPIFFTCPSRCNFIPKVSATVPLSTCASILYDFLDHVTF